AGIEADGAALDETLAAQGNEIGRARAGADEIDGHGVTSPRPFPAASWYRPALRGWRGRAGAGRRGRPGCASCGARGVPRRGPLPWAPPAEPLRPAAPAPVRPRVAVVLRPAARAQAPAWAPAWP